MSIFGPTMTLSMAGDDGASARVVSSVLWSQFAYLRTIARDAKQSGHVANIDVQLPVDFAEWLSFVCGDPHEGRPRDDVDYALAVRESCTTLGLLPKTRIDGRLQQLLRSVAQRFATTLMTWNSVTLDFAVLMAKNRRVRERCTALFLDASQDPRCYVDELLADDQSVDP